MGELARRQRKTKQMSRTSGLALALGATGFLLLACSSGGDDGASSSDFAQRYCALFDPCCVAAGLPTEHKACHMLFGAAVAKDQAAADECIAEYEAMAKQSDWCATFGTKPRPASCEKAYPQGAGGTNGGTQKPGDACELSGDCASSSKGPVSCHHDFGANKDYCLVLAIVGVGEACYGITSGGGTSTVNVPSGVTEVGICDRDAGNYCDSGKCAPLALLGGKCSGSGSCADDANYCGDSTCKPKVASGASCADSSEACVETAYCDFPDDVCKARLPDGSTCDTNVECLSHYCSGTCKPSPGIGGLTLAAFCG